MKGYARFAYSALGELAERRVPTHPQLQLKLARAHRLERAGVYLASLYLTAGIVALAALVLALALGIALHAPLLVMLIAPALLAGWACFSVFAVAPVLLENEAKERAKAIDESLPPGLNYLLALANAGLPPVEMWGSLARAKVFGALSFEAERIHRDLALMSQDILQALRNAQDRTPSQSFHEFLQGAISAFQSGVELESYLKAKGAQYQREAVEEQKKVLDTMGVMAEAFLVVVVAAPLFLIILLTVMSINQGAKVITYGFLLTFLFIPFAQLLIGAVIRGMDPRTWT